MVSLFLKPQHPMSGDGFITSFNVDDFQEIQKIYCGCNRHDSSFAISPDKRQLSCGRCKHNTIKLYSIYPDCSPSQQSQRIELSKNGWFVMSYLVAINIDCRIIRQFVTLGVCVNEEEFTMVVDMFWDLIDFNEANGRNISSFMNEQRYESNKEND
eukprot:TRINITY_DN3230_c0_g2_i1.p1 TRINITY_DN3230_c0_g2~~TRINITY_DN3230_c0_g2_i1.p1  ORF type:complete len:156 (-),score=27.07 TRINITY_DN3230_c0_g2_i1:270-737(-)